MKNIRSPRNHKSRLAVISEAALYIKKGTEIVDVQIEIVMGILNFYSLTGSSMNVRLNQLLVHHHRRSRVLILWRLRSRRRLCHVDARLLY